jgi:D-3-phosphoglycerate dehydrogenase
MLLALLRKIAIADHEVREGTWNREKNRGSEIKGKTIGIIGFGNTGSAFASKFAGWDVQVIAYDKYKTNYTSGLSFVKESALEDVLASSDIISLHIPLTEKTRYLVNAEFLTRMKPGAILINSSRGRNVDTAALVKALQGGHLGGACLDVFENEKPASYSSGEKKLYSTLASLPNVILTPHIAGWTHESKQRIAEQVVGEVGKLG